MSQGQATQSRQQLEKNIRIFVWFRVLFNARFYYPIFAVFFTDLGLTTSQFLWLNGVWAITIVIAEVPSGVLADLISRRKLVIFSAVSMAAEMLLLILAPAQAGWWLFSLCLANRVLSGLAEAAASGADEALAYDSLKQLDSDKNVTEKKWDDTLVRTIRWRAVGSMVAMLLGGFVFDHQQMTAIFGDFPRIISLKLPIILCFISALVCIFLALKLTDPNGQSPKTTTNLRSLSHGIFSACKWVLHSTTIAPIIIAAVLIDSAARTFATLLSAYMRWIDLPEYSFGIIGAAMSLSSWIVPLYAKSLVQKFSATSNMLIVGAIAILGLTGISFLKGPLGISAAFISMMTLSHLGFLVSRYINKEAPSEQRASILSVKNLALNLGYGAFSFLYALRLKNIDFGDGLSTMPIYLLIGMSLWLALSRLFFRTQKTKS